MSHVPFEYALMASCGVGIAGGLLTSFLTPFGGESLVALSIGSYILYSYSPLPQGPHAPHHKKRKRKWGFSTEYEEGAQKKLGEYNSNGD